MVITKQTQKIKRFLLGILVTISAPFFCQPVSSPKKVDPSAFTRNNDALSTFIKKSSSPDFSKIIKKSPLTRSGFDTKENKGKLFFFIDGPNVSGWLSLGTATPDFLWSDGEDGLYTMWNSQWKIPTKYGTIGFKAIATNDITVGISRKDPWSVTTTGVDLYAHLTSIKNMYEIVIGGWGNTQSAIRKGSQTDPVTVADSGIQDTNMLIEYKIIMYHNDQSNKDVTAVYYFSPNTSTWQKLMSYNGSRFADGPRWFSLNSWDTPIFYVDLYASTETTLPQ